MNYSIKFVEPKNSSVKNFEQHSTTNPTTTNLDLPSPNLFIGFNEDYNCFFCGTETGFYIYNTNPFKKRFNRELDGGIGIVELLGKSNIAALVGGGLHPKYSPSHMILWDDYQNKSIATLEFGSEIKAIRCRDQKIMVALNRKIMLYNFSDLHLILQLDTCENQNGLCAMTFNQERQTILAIPGGKQGDLRIELVEKRKSFAVSAHQNELSKICLSQDGNLCATASNKGTLIRIWNTSDGSLHKELRRGLEQVNILSLNFNHDSTSICLSSDKGTVHIYSLIPRANAKEHEKNKKSSFSFMKNYLPDYFSSEWSLTSFGIPGQQKGICAFSPTDNNVLVIITINGKFYQYRYLPGQNLVQLIKTEHFG